MPYDPIMKRADELYERLTIAQQDYLDGAAILAEALRTERWTALEEAAETAAHMKHEPGFYLARAIRELIEAEKKEAGR